ncbi:chemotaxis protein CheW [Clostridium brassicae]|uniref:Chemotaxis protein CheW n=1 Tax=Clostridium brassicae TaxID=2999072 RepID=A0ABT4DB34_9CLOT|nr:chemotaxis protein CheW [Clostridium brassicae]MCY6959515.1 chemotaxis protein CheW [Clostridium brassicae]
MDEKQYVVFSLKDEEYAIDIMQIYEVDRLKEIKITAIPRVPNYIEGIINLRGEVVPIINLRKRLGLEEKAIDKQSRIIIIRIEGKAIGILVDSIDNVISFVEEELYDPPEEVKNNCEYIKKVGDKGNRLIFILDVYSILTS